MPSKPRKMLGDVYAPYIQSLMRLIETQSKPTLVRWSVGYARLYLLPLYEAAVSGDARPRLALDAADAWMEKKPPETYEAIAARECAKYEAALRAVAVENEPSPAKVNWNC